MAKGRPLLWVIDAGHGGRDVGCEGSKSREKDINLKVALRVAELVRTKISGVKVVMTRDSDTFLSLEQRATKANNLGADLFLSIHVNAAPESNNVRGTETYYGPLDATSNADLEAARRRNIQKSELLAWEMQKYYGLAGRPTSRGVKRERYYVILYTKMPSILTEIGFISTPSEQEYMTSQKGQEEIAQCIFKGLKEYKEVVEGKREKEVLAEMRQKGVRTVPSRSEASGDLAQNADGKSDKDTKTGKSDKDAKPGKTGKDAKETTAKDTADKNTAGKRKTGKEEPAVAKLDPKLEPELDNGTITFSIQIASGRDVLKEGDRRFKGLKDIKSTQNNGFYKYYYGTTDDYAVVRKRLVEVRKLIPDAFIVAFQGTRPISTSDALEMVRKK